MKLCPLAGAVGGSTDSLGLRVGYWTSSSLVIVQFQSSEGLTDSLSRISCIREGLVGAVTGFEPA